MRPHLSVQGTQWEESYKDGAHPTLSIIRSFSVFLSFLLSYSYISNDERRPTTKPVMKFIATLSAIVSAIPYVLATDDYHQPQHHVVEVGVHKDLVYHPSYIHAKRGDVVIFKLYVLLSECAVILRLIIALVIPRTIRQPNRLLTSHAAH